jgi:cyclophilin family peptidyl-prolyl cis-trans isomerase
MKKTSILSAILIYLSFSLYSQTSFPDIILETTEGNITLRLYDNTPLHSKNFIKLVNDGYYDNLLFHRVIKNFMIQGGDPNSKNAKPDEHLGNGGPAYTIPSEFKPEYYHKKGAIAAARLSDQVNPRKESSGSQFYIVTGQIYTKVQLDGMVKKEVHSPFSAEEFNAYTTSGGTPFLDSQYTVFGEVISGFDVLEKISSVQTDANDRPVQDVKIIKAYTKKK